MDRDSYSGESVVGGSSKHYREPDYRRFPADPVRLQELGQKRRAIDVRHPRGLRQTAGRAAYGWRTGGSVDEVIEEAHLDSAHILEAIERFVRLRHLRERLDAAARR